MAHKPFVLDVARPVPAAVMPWRIRFRAMQRAVRPLLRTPEHLSAHHQLLVVREGTYTGRIAGAPVVAPGPCVVATGPGERHADGTDGGLTADAVQFQMLPGPAPDVSMPLMKPGCARVTPLSRTVLADLVSALDALVASQDCPVEIRPHLQDAAAAAVVWRWVALQAPEDRHPEVAAVLASDVFASRLTDLFEHHARHALGVRQMAVLMDMSQRTLDWQCRRAFGMPPAHLFRRHRLRAARAYLLSAQASVAEVAATFGFPSASHFSRVYRGEFARSPVEDLRQMLA